MELEQILKALAGHVDVRGNLSSLRQKIKEPDAAESVRRWVAENEALALGFLADEDPKSRKNAALLLGDIRYLPAAKPLWEAYNREETLFVKSSYLTALSHLDAEELSAGMKERYAALLASEVAEENRKHKNEELRALREILIRYEGITRHTFDSKGAAAEIILTANRTHREIVRRAVGDGAKLHPLGVSVKTDDINSLWRIRFFRELLFAVLAEPKLLSPVPAEAARELSDGGLVELLLALHKERDPFYFRIECQGKMNLEERSVFSKRLAEELERLSGGMLVNSTSDYEIELRLIEHADGGFFPCMKTAALTDPRFTYRKDVIAASIHPAGAALLMELAAPYLKEGAQVIDPFCGVGTMLIERHRRVGAREMYATDIFGEAIEKGRGNAARAGVKINFIHRDFFDFSHDYPFDEIVTNMPVRGRQTKEEMDRLYARFFDKALEITGSEATIIMYTNEIGFVKKQLRIHAQFTLCRETCIQNKTGFYLLIIGVKK